MNRREVPKIGMISYGEGRLRVEGCVALPLDRSFAIDPQRLRPHYHDFFQVSLLTGRTRLMHDFRETETNGATLFFLSPGEVHTIVPGPRTVGTILSFTAGFLEEGNPGLLLDLPFFFTSDRPPWVHVSSGDARWVKEAFREIQWEYDHGDDGAGEIVRSLLRILFVKAARWHARESSLGGSHRQTLIAKQFRQLVERHFHDWPTLSPYARELGISANHLNDVMRAETAQPAGEHLRRRRLLDAKRKLLHSTLDVAEIGYALGFADPSYFSRFFRRYEGVTPVEFRKGIREKYHKGAE